MTHPTTQQLIDQHLVTLESSLNQESPLNDKAFLRVLAVLLGMDSTQLRKYGQQRAAQSLALTATQGDLDILGRNFGVFRKLATSARFTATITGTNGVIIQTLSVFIGESNSVEYSPDANVTVSGGAATLELTALQQGVAGNLVVGDRLNIVSQIAGIAGFATVATVVTIGTDRETDDDYRVRVLDEIRTVGGGSNSADYRRWAQEVPGVARAYPYSGTVPGERVVYVQCTTDIDPDGIAPPAMIDDVRTSIITDPITGRARQALGSINSLLEVDPVFVTPVIFEVRGLTIPGALAQDARDAIEIAIAEYAASCRPFVDGLDSEIDRNDVVTSVAVAAAVNEVLRSFGGFAASIGIGFVIGSYLNSIQLAPGELIKVAQVRYAS
jgi:uncharacterized phage protein gp47/JayE